jgi:hypothetical protein
MMSSIEVSPRVWLLTDPMHAAGDVPDDLRKAGLP